MTYRTSPHPANCQQQHHDQPSHNGLAYGPPRRRTRGLQTARLPPENAESCHLAATSRRKGYDKWIQNEADGIRTRNHRIDNP